MLVEHYGNETTYYHVCKGKKERDMPVEIYRHDIRQVMIVNDDKPCRWEIKKQWGEPVRVPIIGHKFIDIDFCPFCGVNLDQEYKEHKEG